MVAPALVHRHAGLPVPAFLLGDDFLFGRAEVARQQIAIVDDDVRLQFEHHVVHLLRFPALRIEGPGDVVPQDVQRAVVGAELAYLAVDVVDKTPTRLLVIGATRTVGMVPVHQRVVESAT